MKKCINILTAVLCLMLAMGCGKDNNSKKSNKIVVDDGLPNQATGCIQGVVVNGITGQPIPLNSTGRGVEVLVAPDLMRATSVEASSQLTGEFLICGVPTEADYPIFARFDGYQDFQSIIKVHSTREASTKRSATDIISQVPTAVANVRVYPTTALADGYKIRVHHNGSPVAGAKVFLQPSGGVLGQSMSGYLSPRSHRMGPLSATTDEAGNVVFPPEVLTLGATYSYKVIPPVGGKELQSVTGQVGVGLTTRQGGSPYELFCELSMVDVPLSVVSSSLANGDYEKSGVITYRFNRPVEIVPGTLDGVTATLYNKIGAKLPDNQTGNDASEQVALAIDQTIGTTLTVSPIFEIAPNETIEAGIKARYRNIKVRPTSGKQKSNILTLSPTVAFFGGVSPDPTTITIVSGNAQVAAPGATLPLPLVVNVKDQYGANILGATVDFSVYGGGSVSAEYATTDSAGNATVNWTLGVTGTQEVHARIDGLTTIFAASIGNLSTTSGDEQKAYIGETLASPIVFTLVDNSGSPITYTDVTVSVDQSGGGKIYEYGETPAASLVAQTNSSGTVTIYWNMGTDPGRFRITAKSGDLPEAYAYGSSVLPVLTKVSGDDQMAEAGKALTLPLKFRLRDQNDNPLDQESVSVSVAGGGTPSTTAVTSDAAGEGQLTWTLGTTGAQSLTLTFKGRTVTYSARIISLGLTGGAGQEALVGSELDPIAFNLVDGEGNPIAGETITVTVEDADGGTISGNGQVDKTEIDFQTSAEGLVEPVWTLGTTGGNFNLTFTHAKIATPGSVMATAQMPTTLSGTGTGTTDLGLTVTDQNGDPIEGVLVQLTSDGDGTLAINGGVSENPAEGTTDLVGKVAAVWTVGTATKVTATLPNFTGVTEVEFLAP